MLRKSVHISWPSRAGPGHLVSPELAGRGVMILLLITNCTVTTEHLTYVLLICCIHPYIPVCQACSWTVLPPRPGLVPGAWPWQKIIKFPYSQEFHTLPFSIHSASWDPCIPATHLWAYLSKCLQLHRAAQKVRYSCMTCRAMITAPVLLYMSTRLCAASRCKFAMLLSGGALAASALS